MTEAAVSIVRALAEQRAPRDNEYFYCTMCGVPEADEHTPVCPWRMAVEFVGDTQTARDPGIRKPRAVETA